MKEELSIWDIKMPIFLKKNFFEAASQGSSSFVRYGRLTMTEGYDHMKSHGLSMVLEKNIKIEKLQKTHRQMNVRLFVNERIATTCRNPCSAGAGPAGCLRTS